MNRSEVEGPDPRTAKSGEPERESPALRVLDCTIRDGGLTCRHRFEERTVRAVYEATSAAGVHATELGYRNSPEVMSPDDFGAWMFCADEDLRRVIDGVERPATVSVMVDVGRVDPSTFGPAERSPIDMVRTATYVKDVGEAIELGHRFQEQGYETSLNIMAISRDRGPELTEALDRIEAESRTPVVYIVDSFGALRPHDVVELVRRFRRHLPSKEIGFHAHNQLQLAYANTLVAIEEGARWVDGTVYGIGRAAGNCPLELLVGQLGEERYDVRPLLRVIADELLPLREKIEWGYTIPYAITGMWNQHPRSAMALQGTGRERDFGAFFEEVRRVAEEGR